VLKLNKLITIGDLKMDIRNMVKMFVVGNIGIFALIIAVVF